VTPRDFMSKETSEVDKERISGCFLKEASFYDASSTPETVDIKSAAPLDLFSTCSIVQKDTFKGRPHVNSTDVDQFLQVGLQSPFWLMFSSNFSVGYRPWNLEPQGVDEIFAIVGIERLFILRKTESQQYRIVSTCYLWAAWELDCWNPGTKKGRWGPDVSRPNVEQTRMIEIY
jgi:hypothetical protein